MKLHTVDIQAFGPFVDPVHVDFDLLGSNGLFLLTGPTGAGKSSVLDAVAFAFYGQVPGDRAVAKQLRSHQAEEHVRPVVELEATIGERRVRLTRSPAWQRPKKRGHGSTTEQASVSVRELRAGEWALLTTRHDEAGQLVTDWLGMTLTQFTQVAMLPQGQFQAFLRADSDARLALLQRLFRTGRHEQVERWLKERRLTLGRLEHQRRDLVRDRLNRLSEVAGVVHPWQDLNGAPVETERPRLWAHALRQELRDRAGTMQDLHEALSRESVEAFAAAARARDTATLQEQARAARATVERLELQAEEMAAERAAVERSERLALLVPWHNRLLRATSDHDLAARNRQLALTELRDAHPDLAGLDAPDLAAGVQELLDTITASLQDAEQAHLALRDASAAVQQHRAELTALSPQLEALAAEAHALPALRAEVQARVEAAQRASQQLPALTEQVSAAAQLRAAAVLAEQLGPEVERARGSWAEIRERQQSLKDRWLDLREARLTGMAAELAGSLSSGCACPVCGSAEHPVPARHAVEAVTARDERAARSALDDAEVQLLAADAHHAELRTRLVVARDQSNDQEVADAVRHLAQLQERRSELAAVAQGWEQAEGEAAALGQRGESLAAEHAQTATEHARLSQQVELGTAAQVTLTARWQDVRDRLVELMLADPAEAARAGAEAVLSMSRGHHRSVSRLVETAEHTQRSLDQAQRMLDELRLGLDEVLAGVDLDGTGRAAPEQQSLFHQDPDVPGLLDLRQVEGLGALVASMLTEDQVRVKRAQIGEYARALDAARRTLADPVVLAAEGETPADPRAAEQTRQHTQHRSEAANVQAAQAQRSASRVNDLVRDLDAAVAAWAPVVAEHALADAVSRLADGSSHDNHPSMRLSTYVLQQRFAAVIAAANVRLGPMSDARYELEQSGARLAGERRGGLSLVVTDAWSGLQRDPATLSGGETFVVSLALALGLADVVMAEAGGTVLETLFVDEGFGALDPDTLDDVMNVLDGLRSGGRTVGVVSHVPEMRDRIPTQLRVHKNRSGSSVQVVGT